MFDSPRTAASQRELLQEIASLLEQVWRMQRKHDADLREILQRQKDLRDRNQLRHVTPGTGGGDAIADYLALETSRFPAAECEHFRSRWQMRPVTHARVPGR